jgi:hypothetical protein
MSYLDSHAVDKEELEGKELKSENIKPCLSKTRKYFVFNSTDFIH